MNIYSQTEPKVFPYGNCIHHYLHQSYLSILSIYNTPQLSMSVFCSYELFQIGLFWLMCQRATTARVQGLRWGGGIGRIV